MNFKCESCEVFYDCDICNHLICVKCPCHKCPIMIMCDDMCETYEVFIDRYFIMMQAQIQEV